MAFKFRLPTYNDLNAKQKVAVSNPQPIALSGGPGTGKSVVSVWRHILNWQNGKSSLLLTYTKSLRYFLAQSVLSYSRLESDIENKARIEKAGFNVKQANSWVGSVFDEIIIDEAQDLPPDCFITFLKADISQPLPKPKDENHFCITRFPQAHISDDRRIIDTNGFSYWIGKEYISVNERYRFQSLENSINYIRRFSNNLSYGADDSQILYPKRSTSEAQLAQIFPKVATNTHKLVVNYRNTYEILNFVKHTLDFEVKQETLDRLEMDETKRGQLPVLQLESSVDKQNAKIFNIIEDFNDGQTNIVILVPLKRDVFRYKELLKNNGYKDSGDDTNSFSSYCSSFDMFDRISNIHITTFKSVKGLEFDVVIIPDFGDYKEKIETLDVVNDEDYYVAFTRARKNLFLISDKDVEVSGRVLKREIEKEKQPKADPVPSPLYDDLADDLPF